MIKKPDDISEEHFERMVEAMLVHRNALKELHSLPHTTSPRSKEYRRLSEEVRQAHWDLTDSYHAYDDEEDAA